MNKWLLLLALLTPAAKANQITPAFTQGSMNSTTTTTQVINETITTNVVGGELNTWSGSNVHIDTSSEGITGGISVDSQVFEVVDTTLPWTFETVTREAGTIETITEVRDITTNATTTSLSVFSQ
jgi:hypothetical protein|tara:strand:+ start:115 stop:489 length:375 start_codon:yes stop_codon:yes gene_type:complete